ncbi:hypothetical protein CYMTET_4650 [Cymbomonas tetramitiformis]|uniref:Uncharacterized protein n=1 Tax=Cymbomonas tetramitiformis TaxID=36881 RepID=A0AAE0H0R7_9CHLO|nr:hypothetical protein CYMTET_4650 [Cymbomonas tetramitiformis]
MYITHNGDLDFWDVRNVTYPLEHIQEWLEKILDCPSPAPVDSAAIAGLIDLLRTQGLWTSSVRYGCIFGRDMGEDILEQKLPTTKQQQQMAAVFEAALEAIIKQSPVKLQAEGATEGFRDHLRKQLKLHVSEAAYSDSAFQCLEIGAGTNMHLNCVNDLYVEGVNDLYLESGITVKSRIEAFVGCTVDAFFDNDLLHTTRFFLANAKGSFGLCVSSSLDAGKELVVAARGQTMSVAFYPDIGIVCFASEQAAAKAGLLAVNDGEFKVPAFRVDLDDLGGELMRLSFSNDNSSKMPPQAMSSQKEGYEHVRVMECNDGRVLLGTIIRENTKILKRKFDKRKVLLQSNVLVPPIPPTVKDPVGTDISEIPYLLNKIQTDWRNMEGMNRVTAWNFMRELNQRLLQPCEDPSKGPRKHAQVDILVSGCEVSLWAAEQFADDLGVCLPRLNIVTMSANKMLGLFGQLFPIPMVGHPFTVNEERYDFKNCVILLVSHSGGTFSSLAVANLMKAYTSRIFVVTSEWDTQIGRALRDLTPTSGLSFRSNIFSTGCGFRPAEPCSISLAATHQLLTQILLYILHYLSVVATPEQQDRAGVFPMSEVRQLEGLNIACIEALEDIVGFDRDRKYVGSKTPDAACHALRQQGALWARHVLEVPRVWILSAVYIVVTVVLGVPPATMISCAVLGVRPMDRPVYVSLVANTVDAILYIFLPLWMTILLRLWEKRHPLHRLGTRTVVVGDVPWVAQSIEAFLSKLFGCSYSIASLNVASGNPVDHLVHRHTHRVVRGSLIAVGRPDGRLNALVTAEGAVNLSVNQASSIQSYGVRCESITIGHNPSKLTLSANHITLRDPRKQFICEQRPKGRNLLSHLYTLQREDMETREFEDAAAVDELSPTMVKLMRRQNTSMQAKSITMNLRKNLVPLDEEYIGQQMSSEFPGITQC